MENRPLHPGIAIDIERNLPMILCHSFVAIVRCECGIEWSISSKRAALCSGNDIVLLIESTSHPNMTIDVAHLASPFFNFLMDAGSCRNLVSVELRGRNTWSRD
jgi:hypothetical protein